MFITDPLYGHVDNRPGSQQIHITYKLNQLFPVKSFLVTKFSFTEWFRALYKRFFWQTGPSLNFFLPFQDSRSTVYNRATLILSTF